VHPLIWILTLDAKFVCRRNRAHCVQRKPASCEHGPGRRAEQRIQRESGKWAFIAIVIMQAWLELQLDIPVMKMI
jgi:hypothetical protein